MVDNLFALAAAHLVRQEASTSSDFLADPDFVAGSNLDPTKAYTFDELREEYASWHKARELAEQDDDEDDDVDRDFSSCSYELGYIKQEVYGCKTCAVEGGLCVCCYHSCHDGHDLFPVDPKRHFRCDCPTMAFPGVECTLAADASTRLVNISAGAAKLPPNIENRYGQNFGNLFCWCSTPYGDERFAGETMIQCVLCEEWYHEIHLNLKQPSRLPLPPNSNVDDSSAPAVLLHDGEYAALVCEACVLAEKHAPLADYFGTPRFVGLAAEDDGKWDRLGFVEGVEAEDDTDDESAAQVENADSTPGVIHESKPVDGRSQSPSPVAGSSKRPVASSPTSGPSAKKSRPLAPTCTLTAGTRDPRATALLERRKTTSLGHNGWGTGRCDLFIQPGFRRNLCRCDIHAPLTDDLPALFGRPEETWQPLSVAGSGSATRPPRARALTEAEFMPLLTSTFGHQRAVDGVQHALAGMTDFGRALGKYIEGLAPVGSDILVTKEDVERFTRDYKAKIEDEKSARGR